MKAAGSIDGFDYQTVNGYPSRMGRPPMKVVLTNVRLPIGTAERIDAVAGKNRRAQFIRDAVEAELRRRESVKPK